MEGKREGNFTFLEGYSAEKKDKNEKFYFAEVEALVIVPDIRFRVHWAVVCHDAILTDLNNMADYRVE